jgi:hypothetical protein
MLAAIAPAIPPSIELLSVSSIIRVPFFIRRT